MNKIAIGLDKDNVIIAGRLLNHANLATACDIGEMMLLGLRVIIVEAEHVTIGESYLEAKYKEAK